MDQRGQASSVFNLLISAVVAIAILAILLSIIYPIIIPDKDAPFKESVKILKSASTQPASTQISSEVTWNKESTPINARNLSLNTGEVNETQLCVHLGSLQGDPAWNNGGASDGRSIEYTGNSNLKTKVIAFCDSCAGPNGSGMDFSAAGTRYESILQNDSCGSVPNFQNNSDGTCCVIALMRS